MQVLFLKSGVPFGYGYSAGETGRINQDHANKLIELGVIEAVAPEQKRQTAESPQAKQRVKRGK